ncbi:MAG: hypothetical protein K1Y36_12960 [Blastocatellia bacterium]|nr:hypothetical protein [Blastocatellia bacterium]
MSVEQVKPFGVEFLENAEVIEFHGSVVLRTRKITRETTQAGGQIDFGESDVITD